MQQNIEKIARPPFARHDFEPLVGAVHPSGARFACAGGTIVDVRSASDGSLQRAAPLAEAVTRASFSPDGARLLLATTDARVQALDASTLAPIAKTPALYDTVESIAWLGRAHFAAATARGEVNVYELATLRLVSHLVAQGLDDGHLGSIATTADGSHLFLSIGQTLTCIETRSAQPVWTQMRHQEYDGGHLALSPDARWLALGTRDGLALHDARTGRAGPMFRWSCAESVSWPGHEYQTWTPRPVFTRQGTFVLVNDRVGNLVRIDVRALACPEEAPRQPGLAWISELHAFPDGEHLLVLGTDNSAAIWRLDPFAGRLHVRAIDALPESAYDALYDDEEDDGFDEDDDFDGDDAR